MKKILKCLVLFCFAGMLFGCNNKIEETKDDLMYHNLEKLDDYLYKIDFDDYRYDSEFKTIKDVESFACSSVKNGNFYGRNYDFIYNDIIEFVVNVKANENRHASIGIVNNSDYRVGFDENQKYNKDLELIPNSTLDGINDQGVIASINVVPKDDVDPITGTNPGKEDLPSLFIVRYVLDNADSASDAIELLKNRNIYGSIGEHYNLHVMIADSNNTYVVEFIDNKMVAQEKFGNEQIMTNYYVNLPELTENASGVERYQILQENYDEGNTFEGMYNLLKRVRFSNEYLYDKESEWYSEFLPQSTIKSLTPESKAEIDAMLLEVKHEYWYVRGDNKRNPANINFWFTTHNSTYDIENRKIRITVQENYNKYYEYTLK